MDQTVNLNSNKIVHISTVHTVFDTRIFHKECKTLAKSGYNVVLIAQHDEDENIDNIQILALPRSTNRLDRMTRILWKAYQTAIKENAEIYHFHDPELIPVGMLLKLRGKRVIYDVHEDVSLQILSNHSIHKLNRIFAAKVVKFLEWFNRKFFNAIVAATPTIANHFLPSKTITVQNFPVLSQLVNDDPIPYQERSHVITYVGVVGRIRGAKEMVKSLELLPADLKVTLLLAGNFSPPEIGVELKHLEGWHRVKYLGWQSRREVAEALGRSRVGLVVLHPKINYLDSYPVKLFEYMSASLPVVASNFPLWKEIVEGNNCGICVDPLNPREIAKAIEYLINNPTLAKEMGENGRRCILEKYNWGNESEKLIELYRKILKPSNWDYL